LEMRRVPIPEPVPPPREWEKFLKNDLIRYKLLTEELLTLNYVYSVILGLCNEFLFY
jgi:hypothetical protein